MNNLRDSLDQDEFTPEELFEGLSLSEIRKILTGRGLKEDEIKKKIEAIDDYRIDEEYRKLHFKKINQSLLIGKILMGMGLVSFIPLYLGFIISADKGLQLFSAFLFGAGYFIFRRGKKLSKQRVPSFKDHVRKSFADIQRL